jgi:hypothetical protein
MVSVVAEKASGRAALRDEFTRTPDAGDQRASGEARRVERRAVLRWTRTNRQPHPPDLAVRASLFLFSPDAGNLRASALAARGAPQGCFRLARTQFPIPPRIGFGRVLLASAVRGVQVTIHFGKRILEMGRIRGSNTPLRPVPRVRFGSTLAFVVTNRDRRCMDPLRKLPMPATVMTQYAAKLNYRSVSDDESNTVGR